MTNDLCHVSGSGYGHDAVCGKEGRDLETKEEGNENKDWYSKLRNHRGLTY